MIVFIGDLVNGCVDEIEFFIYLFWCLDVFFGKYVVIGNYDYSLGGVYGDCVVW